MSGSSGPTTHGAFQSKASTTNGQTKKLVIKPLKLKPQLPKNFEEVTWAKLQDAVNAVHCKRPVSTSLEELYRAVEDMCIHKMADSLYKKLQHECDKHIQSELNKLKKALQLEPLAFLERFNVLWLDHCSQMLTIRQIFLYLDRTYVLATSGVRSLFDTGLQLFRKHLLNLPEVQERTITGLLQLIERERVGEQVDRQLLKSLLTMLTNLSLYADSFQVPFLEQTHQFYLTEGNQYLHEADVPDYMLHCERRLTEEFERCQHYLDPSTRKSLIQAVEKQLVSRHIATILEKGFALMMDASRQEDLARLYVLCARIQAQEALRVAFRDYIKAVGAKIVKDEERDKDMVERLLELKSRLDLILEQSFQHNEGFANALKEAFETFINQRQSKPAELIAKYIDTKLRAGNKGQTEDETEATLDKALILFRFIQGKDVFEAFYKKDLAKRLLLGKSASIDAEKSMISKLKAECGSQFTNKLEGMFKDIELSKEIVSAFKQSTGSGKGSSGLEMNVNVLTSGYWPTYPITEANMPEELGRHQEVFKDFYLGKYNGRKLVWYNSLGSCVLKGYFPKGPKELSVSLFQTVVLMLFNDSPVLSFKEIAEMSGIEDKELRRTLQSLACGKMRVLIKEPKGRDVEDDDVFHFNDDFSDKHFRIKINSIQMKETQEENKKTNEEVLQDRQYQIDAAIVRIMKTRKTLSHKLLVQEVLQQLKFPLRAADLKKRIESLIDREYLARDPKDAQIYNYLA